MHSLGSCQLQRLVWEHALWEDLLRPGNLSMTGPAKSGNMPAAIISSEACTLGRDLAPMRGQHARPSTWPSVRLAACSGVPRFSTESKDDEEGDDTSTKRFSLTFVGFL